MLQRTALGALVALLSIPSGACATPPPIKGHTWYVAPSGSDRGPGTRKRPWKTLRRARARARLGDTVVLGPGTYGERGRITDFRVDGSEHAPITFTGSPGRPRPRFLGHVRVSGDHVTLRRMLFDGPTGPVVDRDGENPRGETVQLWIKGSDVEIARSEIRNNAWHAGIYVTADHARIVGNRIHDNGDRSDPRQANLDHGIYWGSGDGGLIANNVIDGNLAYGVHLYPRPSRVTVAYNTIINQGKGGVILADDASQNQIIENVIAGNGSYGIATSGLDGHGNVAINNLGWANGLGDIQADDGLTASDTRVADPRLSDSGVPGPGSPAIDAGDEHSAPGTDIRGNRRPQGKHPDLGAFEVG